MSATNKTESGEREFTFAEIPVRDIDAAGNYRKHFDPVEDERLLHDVAAHGFRHPFAVVRDAATGRYRLVGGFRRFIVARTLGKVVVPCLVYARELSEGEFALDNFRDNGFRSNPDPVDEAFGLLRIKQLLALNQKELAREVGKSEAMVCKLLAITDLPVKVHELIRGGKLTVETAYKLASLRDETVFDELLAHAVARPDALMLPPKRMARSQAIGFAGMSIRVPADVPPVRFLTDTAKRLLAALKEFKESGDDATRLGEFLKQWEGKGHESAATA